MKKSYQGKSRVKYSQRVGGNIWRWLYAHGRKSSKKGIHIHLELFIYEVFIRLTIVVGVNLKMCEPG